MRKFLDLESAFYAPLWIRVAVTAVLVLWGVFELSQGAYIWALIFLAVGAVCGVAWGVAWGAAWGVA